MEYLRFCIAAKPALPHGVGYAGGESIVAILTWTTTVVSFVSVKHVSRHTQTAKDVFQPKRQRWFRRSGRTMSKMWSYLVVEVSMETVGSNA